MAARAPRKLFASPFVVTLAAIPACYTESAPPPQQPQPQPVVQRPAEPAQGSAAEIVVANPPRPAPAPAEGTAAPQPQTYAFDQRWTVMKHGDKCSAMVDVDCPKPKHPGDPVPTCNPPPPMKIACPDGWDGKATLAVVQYANTAECVIEPPPMKCPPGTKCNPPPPRKVACPTY